MLNSRNYQSDEQVLNSGEEVFTDPEEYKDPNAKTYYHYIPNAITHLPDGAQLTFRGGIFVTANPEIQAYLDKIANKRGSMVYTKQEKKEQIDSEVRDVALTAMVPAGDQGKKNEDGSMEPDLTKKDNANLVSESAGTAKLLLKPGVVPATQA